jgi:hypothetical protein
MRTLAWNFASVFYLLPFIPYGAGAVKIGRDSLIYQILTRKMSHVRLVPSLLYNLNVGYNKAKH